MLTGVAESIVLCMESKLRRDGIETLEEIKFGDKTFEEIKFGDKTFGDGSDLASILERLQMNLRESRWSEGTHDDRLRKHYNGPMNKPERFVRRITHRNQSLLPGDGDDCVIAPWSTGGGVDEEVDHVVGDPGGRGLGEHDVHVYRPKDLLEGIEGQPTQFAFDEVWPVLHDGFELDVAVPGLPARDEVEHVGAVARLAFFSTLCAGEGHAQHAEKGQIGDLVPHPKEARVEVDLGQEGRDGDQGGVAHDQEGRDRLVEEARVDVGGLLQNDDVPSGPLGRADLPR